MTNEIKSFRDILRAEFQNRLKSNPHYRLLDFAKDLATPISRMSEIMSGRSGISTQRALHYTESLKLSPEEKRHFLQLVSNECSRTKWTRKSNQASSDKHSGEIPPFFSSQVRVPTHKKEEFIQFLKSTLNQWASQNGMSSSDDLNIVVAATENKSN